MELTKAEKRTYLIKFCALEALNGAAQCAYSIFILLFLRSRGLGDFQSGLVVSLNALASVAGRYLFSYLSDRTRRPKAVLLGLAVLEVLLAAPFLADLPITALIACSALYHLVAQSLPSMIDSWFFKTCYGFEEKFSIPMLFNVITVTIFGALNGLMADRLGWNALFWFQVAVNILMVASVLWIRERPPRPAAPEAQEEKVSFGILLKNRRYLFVVLWMTVLGVFSMMICSFLPVSVEAVGGNAADFGLVRVFMYLFTIPMLLRGDRLVTKFQSHTLFLAVTLCYALSGGILFLSRNSWMVALGGVFYGLGSILGGITMRAFVVRVTPYHISTMAQSAADAMFVGCASILSGLLGGILTEQIGVQGAMLLCGGMGILCGAVMLGVSLVTARRGGGI